MTSRPPGSLGFSIMELMVSISILALLSVGMVPTVIQWSAAYNKRNAEMLVLQDLRRAQATTVEQGCQGIFTVDGDSRGYSFGRTAGIRLRFTTMLSSDGIFQRTPCSPPQGSLCSIPADRSWMRMGSSARNRSHSVRRKPAPSWRSTPGHSTPQDSSSSRISPLATKFPPSSPSGFEGHERDRKVISTQSGSPGW